MDRFNTFSFMRNYYLLLDGIYNEFTKENYQQKYERNKIKLRWATIGSLLMFAITIG